MDKMAKWKKKMDEYYANITVEQLKIDLESAGFVVNTLHNMENIRNLYPSFNEVAASSEISELDKDEELIQGYIAKVILVK
jgi:hypothetical protein